MSITPQGAQHRFVPSAAEIADERQGMPEQPRDGTQQEPAGSSPTAVKPAVRVEEIGGPPGPEPTRYGDWQFNGRVTDF